jgi:hypothetical protein
MGISTNQVKRSAILPFLQVRDMNMMEKSKETSYKVYKIDHSNYRKIGSLDLVDVYVSTDSTHIGVEIYAVSRALIKGKKNKVIMHVWLDKKRGMFKDGVPIYSVGLARVDDSAKGFGVAPRVYALFMKKTGWMLKAGDSQSIGGKNIWSELTTMTKINVFAYSKKDDEYHTCKKGIGEVDCDVDVYAPSSKFFLYATYAP